MTDNAQQQTTVPREIVERIAASFKELMELRDKQNMTIAQMLRGCVQALTQTTEQARRRLERERLHLPAHRQRVGMHEPGQRVREDRERALLYLQWLATSLENQSVRLPDAID